MRARTTTLFITTALAAGLGASPAAAAGCADADAAPGTASTAAIRTATLCLLNEQRAENGGLPPLKAQHKLTKAAFRFSKTMVKEGFFDHVSPSGSTLDSRIQKVRYTHGARAWSLGENIAWGTGDRATPAAIVDAWMHSPGHRANILDKTFSEIGIGVAPGAPVATGASVGATYTTDFGFRK